MEETLATGPKLKVTVIIPVYNEVASIVRVLTEIQALPDDPEYSFEILVVDGGSTDGTLEVAREAGVRVVAQRGRGYGAACYTGFEEAPDADILVFLDGDYSDPPAAIPLLLDKLLKDGADLALGTRRSGQIEKGALPVHAVWGNRLVAWLIGRLYRQPFTDLPSLKAVWRENLASFGMREMTYGWTTEMLVKAARSGCKIVEVPVNYRKRAGGQSKVSGTFKGTVKAGYHLFKTALSYTRWQPGSE